MTYKATATGFCLTATSSGKPAVTRVWLRARRAPGRGRDLLTAAPSGRRTRHAHPMDARGAVESQLKARLPILTWLPAYQRANLTGDLLAGAVVAALIVPQALGYAGIAGVPVEMGLYAIPLALVAYAFFGSSRQLVVGPVSTVSVLSGSLVATQARGDSALAIHLTAALAISSGIALVVVGLLGLGWVAEFLSKPIVTGFVFGLTVVIIVGELPSLLGVPCRER